VGDNPVTHFQPAPIKPSITRADVEKLDVRVGTILAVEELEQSRKLVRLRVDFGDRVRNILAGINAERANPREIEGRQALFVVNLEAKRMAGELSEECCSTSATRTASHLCSPFPRNQYPMELVQARAHRAAAPVPGGDQCLRLLANRRSDPSCRGGDAANSHAEKDCTATESAT
jgi:tRNA-binding protein